MGSLRSALVALTGVCLLIFVVVWGVGAVYFGVKSRSDPGRWVRGLRRGLPRRLPLIVGAGVFVVVVRQLPGSLWHHLRYWQPELAILGALLVVLSTALLVWARWTLGTMWANVPVVHQHHELRTGGPYRLVRHPIYTGMLGLILGATLACGFGVWVIVLAAALPWLLRRVRVEDAMMAGRFGASYEAYRARVPALLPWPRPTRARPRQVDDRRR